MFTDNIKVYCAIQDVTDQKALQNDLNVLEQWSLHLLLRFNIYEWCAVAHQIQSNHMICNPAIQRKKGYIQCIVSCTYPFFLWTAESLSGQMEHIELTHTENDLQIHVVLNEANISLTENSKQGDVCPLTHQECLLSADSQEL